jgi:hypothetical protein
VILLGTAAFVGYHAFDGRYVMAGVALSSATWGVVLRHHAAAIAVVAVSAATVLLSLVNYTEKPAGIGLFEGTRRESIWTLPREWAQSFHPEVARMIGYLDTHARRGTTLAVSRDRTASPFAFVGYPGIEHRLVLTDTLSGAAAAGAEWAVLTDEVACEDGWRRELRSPPWAVYRHVRGASCR